MRKDIKDINPWKKGTTLLFEREGEGQASNSDIREASKEFKAWMKSLEEQLGKEPNVWEVGNRFRGRKVAEWTFYWEDEFGNEYRRWIRLEWSWFQEGENRWRHTIWLHSG